MATTFLGLAEAPVADVGDAGAAVIGLPLATPYPWSPVDCTGGPKAIRAGSGGYSSAPDHYHFEFEGTLIPSGASAVDVGDLAYDSEDYASNRQRIAAAVRGLLEQGAVPIALGGDDSVPIPFFQAYEGRGPFTIVQVDAHIDWRDDVQGERLGYSSNMRRASEMSWITDIVQIGARGVGSARVGDYEDAVAWGAKFFPARRIEAEGIGSALAAVPENKPVILNIDLDGLDPAVMPAVSARSPGGLNYWDVANLILGVADRSPIAGVCLAEFMPAFDVNEAGARTASRLGALALGAILRQ